MCRSAVVSIDYRRRMKVLKGGTPDNGNIEICFAGNMRKNGEKITVVTTQLRMRGEGQVAL